jgi:hypothetical protein
MWRVELYTHHTNPVIQFISLVLIDIKHLSSFLHSCELERSQSHPASRQDSVFIIALTIETRFTSSYRKQDSYYIIK